MKNFLEEFFNNYEIVIGWGIGRNYESMSHLVSSHLSYLIDADEKKQKMLKDNLVIESPKKLLEIDKKKCLIIIFPTNYEAICRMIFHYGSFDTIRPQDCYYFNNLLPSNKRNISGNIILSVAGSEAVFGTNGCRKFIDTQSMILRNHQYNTLVIVPIGIIRSDGIESNNLLLIYNGIPWKTCYSMFVGTIIPSVEAIIIHSLYYSYQILDEIAQNVKCNGNIIYYIHDYFCVCINRFLYNQYIECESIECLEQCQQCEFYSDRRKVYEFHKKFFEKRKVRLLAPSEITGEIVSRLYPMTKLSVIPHLKYDIINRRKDSKIKSDRKLRIAYIGLACYLKGWYLFKKIVNELKDEYEFYCLGSCNDRDRIENVEYVNVSLDNTEKQVTLKQTLEMLEIDMAFLGAVWKETFSYTYFEVFEAGVYTLVNSKSGNIYRQTLENKNGRIFDTVENVVLWLRNREQVCYEINHNYQRIINVEGNDEFLITIQ